MKKRQTVLNIKMVNDDGAVDVNTYLSQVTERLKELDYPVTEFIAQLCACMLDSMGSILVQCSENDEITLDEARDWLLREIEEKFKGGFKHDYDLKASDALPTDPTETLH